MILLTIVLGAIAAFFFVFHWIQHLSRFAKLLNAFPGPPALPVVGHILELSSKPDEMFTCMRRILKPYSKTIRIWVGYYGTLHIVTADDAEIILSSMKTLQKGRIYELLHNWLGTGLLTSTGEKWQQRRKMLTPAFHFTILRKFVEIFGEHSENLIKKINDECGKSKTNVIPLLADLTLTNICETAMGLTLDPTDEIQKKYIDGIQRVFPPIVKRMANPVLHPDILYNISPIGRLQQKIVESLHPFTKGVIRMREENFNDVDLSDFESETEDNINMKMKKKRSAMLDLLISAKRQRGEIDDEGIREEVDTFVFEGHDTTAAAACFSLMVLANHKDVQEKVIAELDDIFGESKHPATYDELQKMKYLERCLKESLRLYPSVPAIGRKITEDIQLTHHVAPRGTEIFIHINEIHRDPVYFPDPEKFDPDRFLPENSKGRHPYAYLPFSAGPRNCIGQKFAMLELKSIVSSVLRNFTMEPVDNYDDLTWKVDLILRTTGPIHIKFVKRN